jgi:hypothetical protein
MVRLPGTVLGAPTAVARLTGITSVRGLPDHMWACLFDLDGLTSTTMMDAAPWRDVVDVCAGPTPETVGTPDMLSYDRFALATLHVPHDGQPEAVSDRTVFSWSARIPRRWTPRPTGRPDAASNVGTMRHRTRPTGRTWTTQGRKVPWHRLSRTSRDGRGQHRGRIGSGPGRRPTRR